MIVIRRKTTSLNQELRNQVTSIMPLHHNIGCLIARWFLRRARRKTLKEIGDLGSPFRIPPANYSNFTQGGAGFDYKTFMADELKWLHEHREELKRKLGEEE